MEPIEKPTPMNHVWAVVLGTMAVTTLLLYVWHLAVVSSIDTERTVKNAELRAELSRLAGYKTELENEKGVSTSTTP